MGLGGLAPLAGQALTGPEGKALAAPDQAQAPAGPPRPALATWVWVWRTLKRSRLAEKLKVAAKHI